MPVHDWTPDREWIFWDLRLSWLVRLTDRLNHGGLPAGYFAMIGVRPRGLTERPERRIHIHSSLKTIVAVVELVNPQDKEDATGAAACVARVYDAVRAGRHVVVIDVLPATPAALWGINAAVREKLKGGVVLVPSPDAPLSVASYEVGAGVVIHEESFTVGMPLPAAPLFLEPGVSVPLPLEDTYMERIAKYPAHIRADLGDLADPATAAPPP